ncbi:hypothetical protein AWB74_08195 [Caballeronia arvi]|uniref:Uncharacterized protein n=1 Tax=Caballeronia arvi TaxID=1777135 RepID=A0A158L2R1_9BURK|nr:hypothetical protein [Caballeronia arvi]SAL87632.1 hypothetical protein AWB74_08195 [Caballeronia arvi]
MAQGADDFDDDDEAFEAFPDPEVARLVLELERIITRRRRAGALGHLVEGRPVPLPVKPSHIELRVLTALAQTYGPVLFGHDFEPVLERVAECGAVVVVQRVLWSDLPEDNGLAARLLEARIPFEILCGTCPEVFMEEAHAELQGFRPRPPTPPMQSDDRERDDG